MVALAAATAESGATMSPLMAVVVTLVIFVFAAIIVAALYLSPSWIEMRLARTRLQIIRAHRKTDL